MLRLLGVPGAIGPGGPAPRLSDKTYALVALIDLKHAGRVDRHVVAQELWEDKDAAAAQANLRNLLSRLRRWEQETRITLLKDDGIALFRDHECVRTDVEELLAAGSAQMESDVIALDRSLGQGLLGDRGLDFGSNLFAWLEEQRGLLQDRLLEMILPAAAAGGAASRSTLKRLLEASPLDERVERALLTNLSRGGSRSAVANEYERFETHLQSETGVLPELETRTLARSLGVPASVVGAPAIERELSKRAGLPRILILPPLEDEFARPSARRAAASLVDDVTFGLARMRTFAVIAPFTARQVATGPVPTAVDTEYVLFTRLLPGRTSGEYRFGFSLVYSSTHEVLIGDSLRFTLGDLPARHADLSRLVLSEVASGVERRELHNWQKTSSPNAYVYFLLGQERLRAVDLPDLRAARRAFRHALEVEPHFAPAMSMISRTLSMEWLLLNRGDESLLAESRRYASMAVDRDPLDPSGYRELGNTALYSHDLDTSLGYLQEAAEKAPHHADVLLDHADCLAHNGRYREASRVMEAARALNPLAPDEYVWVDATIKFFLRDFRGALDQALKMANPDPLGRLIAAAAYLIGDLDTAHVWKDRTLERHPDFKVSDWGRIVPMKSGADKLFFEDTLRAVGFP
ncbi:MAG TPA: tetratricopeptide repeat protein [Devosia sp.]|nr:tetratricopeptide repeat protein [Devosia sp.]